MAALLGNSLKTAKINRIIAQTNMAIAIFHSFGLLTLSSKTLCSKMALTRAPRGTMTRFALLSDGIIHCINELRIAVGTIPKSIDLNAGQINFAALNGFSTSPFWRSRFTKKHTRTALKYAPGIEPKTIALTVFHFPRAVWLYVAHKVMSLLSTLVLARYLLGTLD
jgi:hypothetical protein